MGHDLNNIEDLFKDSFNDYKIQPSQEVWKGIEGKIWKLQFLKFNWHSFNVYYLTAIVTVLISGVLIFTQVSKTTIPEMTVPNSISNNSSIAKNETNHISSIENNKLNDDISNEDNNKKLIPDNKNSDKNTTSNTSNEKVKNQEINNKDLNKSNHNIPLPINKDKVKIDLSDNKLITKKSEDISKVKSLNFVTENKKLVEKVDNSKIEVVKTSEVNQKDKSIQQMVNEVNQKPLIEKGKENINSNLKVKNNEKINNTTNTKIDSLSYSITDRLADSKLLNQADKLKTPKDNYLTNKSGISDKILLNSDLIKEKSNNQFNPSVIENEKINIFDNNDNISGRTTFDNTIPVIYLENRPGIVEMKLDSADRQIVIRKDSILPTEYYQPTHWYFSVYYSPIFNYKTIYQAEPNYTSIALSRKASEKFEISYSFGGEINYNYKNFLFGTGLSYTLINEYFKYDSKSITINANSKVAYIENGGFFKDNEPPRADNTLNGSKEDLSWAVSQVTGDSTWIPNYAQKVYAVYDTTHYETVFSKYNKISYIEMPFIIGYQRNMSKWTVRLKTGLITSYLLNANGRTIALDYDQISQHYVDPLEKKDFTKINFDFTGSLGLSYHIFRGMDIYAEPYFRTNLKSIYSADSPLIKKYRLYGVRFGLGYRF